MQFYSISVKVDYLLYFQAYIKIYQGEELPEPKSMLHVRKFSFKK